MQAPWVLLLFATLAISVFPAVTLQEAANPSEILSRAVQYHQSGDYEKAVHEYRAFLKIHPNVADVRSNMGAALVQLGRLADATEEYKKALALGNATDPNATRFNLGLAYYKMAQLGNAVAEFEQVLLVQPGNQNAAMILADCHMRMGDYDKVVRVLTPFEKSGEQDRAVAYLLGTALIRLGEVEKGQVLIDQILREGETAEAHILLGTAYLMVRDVAGALKEFERAVELNPTLPTAQSHLAKTLRDMGRVDEAQVHFRKELETNPHDFDSLLYTGVYLYKREQNYEEALERFEHALRIRPGTLELRFQIALVYVLTERIDEAVLMIEQIVEEAPDFLEGHVTLTRLYYRLRRTEEAQRHRAIVERLQAEKDAEAVKKVDPEDG